MKEYTQQAKTLQEIDFAVRHDIPVDSMHPYFVDFSHVRGNFKEKRIYRAFNVGSDFTYNPKINRLNKTILFLGGMRGSGKTSEIAKYVLNLDKPDCFFCIVCNIDKELDTNDVEYMDILILQIEKLLKKANEKGLKLDNDIIKDLQKWFSKRVEEVNRKIIASGGATIEVGAKVPSLLSFLKLAGSIKAGITGSRTTASQIRTELKHNFTHFATLLNDFIETTNYQLRKQNLGQELFFVIDGIEKTMSAETRRKIILEDSNRLTQIKVNTLFTLPIELMPEIQKLKMFGNVAVFPFVKIKEKMGSLVNEAIDKFIEFTYKRISQSLFDSEETVKKAILYSGGSPRELLRIYEEAAFNTDETIGEIRMVDVDRAIETLAAECSHFITSKDLELLKKLKEFNSKDLSIPYDEGMDRLMEHLIVMEYNDGSYKRVNPIVEASKIYIQNVGK